MQLRNHDHDMALAAAKDGVGGEWVDERWQTEPGIV